MYLSPFPHPRWAELATQSPRSFPRLTTPTVLATHSNRKRQVVRKQPPPTAFLRLLTQPQGGWLVGWVWGGGYSPPPPPPGGAEFLEALKASKNILSKPIGAECARENF